MMALHELVVACEWNGVWREKGDFIELNDSQYAVAVGYGIVRGGVLQNAVLAAGVGNSFTAKKDLTFTFSITGTSTSRTVKFEIADPLTGVFVPHSALSVTELGKIATQTTGGTSTAPEGWKVNIPAGWTFRTNATAVIGGTLTVKGSVS